MFMYLSYISTTHTNKHHTKWGPSVCVSKCVHEKKKKKKWLKEQKQAGSSLLSSPSEINSVLLSYGEQVRTYNPRFQSLLHRPPLPNFQLSTDSRQIGAARLTARRVEGVMRVDGVPHRHGGGRHEGTQGPSCEPSPRDDRRTDRLQRYSSSSSHYYYYSSISIGAAILLNNRKSTHCPKTRHVASLYEVRTK